MAATEVIIIGGGLGGLECGYILAKNGCKVTVLEQGRVPGGCLQTFTRGKARFDTGFHYVGGLNEGGSLRPLFEYFGLMKLPWKRLDDDCFDEVVIGGESFPFACGHENFAARLAERFPRQKEALAGYTAFLKNVGDHIFDVFSRRDADLSDSIFAKSAYGFLCGTIDDPLLRKVLSGTSLKMELCADRLPLYAFAQINNSFIQSAWRLCGGGGMIAESLVGDIERMGGEVRTGARVTSIEVENGRVAHVVVNGGERLSADWIVSDMHPAATVALVGEGLRKAYRSRISGLENTFGMFTVNIALRPGEVPYLNRNIHIHDVGADLWNPGGKVTESVLVSYAVPRDGGEYAGNVDLLSPMKWSEVEKWQGTAPMERGEEYEEFKRRKAQECIGMACRRISGLEAAIDRIYTSTPLSWENYTGTPEGSAYGVRKDFGDPLRTVLSPRTPIGNLLLTGQNLNLHGVLGVSMTSFFTCAEILGMEAALNGIKFND